ncbi:TRAP transporter large permease [Mesorhizobium sp. SB112]|uniref:TRAP transporter large permease n=1 Tax=Mesorhizobium sp. SB112 TaxID=3151853 RepID=UPI00326391BF
MITVLVIGFVIFVVMGAPVFVALGLSSLAALFWEGIPLALVVQKMVASIDSFVLLAIPFFLLTGHLMDRTGIAHDIVGFAESVVGRFRGGIGHANVAQNVLMGGMTGSAVADTASSGTAMIPAMVKRGYSPAFSAAITACSSIIAVVLPPSVPMIVFCVVTGASVTKLFIAGIIPGLLVALGMMIAIAVVAGRENLPLGRKSSGREIWWSFVKSLPAMTLPVVILGSIRFGIATPTEASVVAAIYSWFLGRYWYKNLSYRDLKPIALLSASTTGVVMMMIAAASLYGLILTRAQVPQEIAAAVTSLTQDPYLVLLLILLIYLAMGAILDLTANIIILVPILYPVTVALGIDPIQFGIVTIIGLAVGLVTPPVGICLFVAASIARVPVMSVAWASLPYIISTLLLVILMIFFPSISTWLPG